ncbi:Hypothetical protein CFV354_1547 [Campylobacter fetus subsp. venerealis NCTC 10354]|nr:hypothetical protein [Campylobacter fetus]EGU24501.1 Hypothetical protein CFV354_1547 [Campylobacter fetus subsp. venerealis NCTC 10354]
MPALNYYQAAHIYYAKSVYSKDSAGMNAEKRYARELGITELEFE